MFWVFDPSVIFFSPTVSFYSSLFGTLQLLCLVTCPLIGYIMDWKMKECKEEKPGASGTEKKYVQARRRLRSVVRNYKDDRTGSVKPPAGVCLCPARQSSGSRRDAKIQKVTNAMRAFILTNVLLIAFGCCSLVDNLPLQVALMHVHRNPPTCPSWFRTIIFTLFPSDPDLHPAHDGQRLHPLVLRGPLRCCVSTASPDTQSGFQARTAAVAPEFISRG